MRTRHLSAVLAALAVAVSTTACGAQGSPAAAGPPVEGDAVVLSGNQFAPAALRTTPGTTVTWTWDDGATQHNVVFSDGPSSPVQAEGAWTRTFEGRGTYDYVCTLHGQMTGTVVVEMG